MNGEISTQQEADIQKLAFAIAAYSGEFNLLFAYCQYAALQERLAERLAETTPIETLVLSAETETLYSAIAAKVCGNFPPALQILGLEKVLKLEQLILSTEPTREAFRKDFHFPLILWVTPAIESQFIHAASNFKSWGATKTFEVEIRDEDGFLKERVSLLLTDENADLAGLEPDLAALQKSWRDRGEIVPAEMAGNLEALWGWVRERKGDYRSAIAHYQTAIAVVPEHRELSIELLTRRAFCAYRDALASEIKDGYQWQETHNFLQETLDFLNPTEATRYLPKLGLILSQLQDWQPLQTLAEAALNLSADVTDNRAIIAAAWGFLAEVAIARGDPQEALRCVREALQNTAEISEIAERQRHRFYFIQGKALDALGEFSPAIDSLETARGYGATAADLELHLEILTKLKTLYFQQQKDYIAAFKLEQEIVRVKQNFGRFAFVGASCLQSETSAEGQNLKKTKNKNLVAPEILASGRDLDTDELVQRLINPQYKVIVLYGKSGVGKSSLVNAGLLPSLREKVVAETRFLPVPIRTYSNWEEVLAKSLEIPARPHPQPLSQTWERGARVDGDILLSESEEETSRVNKTLLPPRPKLGEGRGGEGETLLEPIQQRLQQHHTERQRVVLIFDQFEEFFFENPATQQQHRFFQFLGECLKIRSLKVVFSLRKDYISYLLDVPGMERIGNDILSKNVIYGLTDFSPQEAREIIERLTERSRFRMEEGLIAQLVADLTEDERVRPIELQVVGAQLQEAEIKTLAQYAEAGTKTELVQGYLQRIVRGCGPEQEEIASFVLYLLTDEREIRPLKTRVQLAEELRDLKVAGTDEQLDLVLKILVLSGLVVLVPQQPKDYYQLLHDYLVRFVREGQEPKMQVLIAELERERQQRKEAEQSLQVIRGDIAVAEQTKQQLSEENRKAKRWVQMTFWAALWLMLIAGGSGVWAARQLQQAKEGTQLERAGTYALKLFEYQEIEGLLNAIQAGRGLQKWVKDGQPLEKYPAASPLLALNTILNEIRERNRLQGHKGGVTSAQFSPDGTHIVTTSGDKGDKTVQLWDSSGQKIAVLQGHRGRVPSMNFSPDGTHIVTTSGDKTARLRDASGREIAVLQGHQGGIASAQFSPDGMHIVTASSDNTARLWDAFGRQIVELQGHQSSVNSAQFSLDGTHIVTASSDNTARLWNTSGRELAIFRHQEPVFSAKFSPDGSQIITASAQGTVRLWDLSGRELAVLLRDSGGVLSVNFSPDGSHIITVSSSGTAKLWNTSGQEIPALPKHWDRIWSANFSPDGKRIVTASSDGTARLWDLSGRELAVLRGHWDRVWSANFSPDGKRIVTASLDGTARLWDASGEVLTILELRAHQNRVNSAQFSPDGKHIATASWDGTAKLWDLSGRELVVLRGHQDLVWSANFSPDGQRIVTASFDGTARLWETSGHEIAVLRGHQAPVRIRPEQISPDGQPYVIVGEEIERLFNPYLNGYQTSVENANFSPNGKQIITASSDGTARLWDLSGRELAVLRDHQDRVRSASFSPDGKRLITASLDKTVRLWDTLGQELAVLRGHQDEVNSAQFSPDGKRIITASRDKTARLWDASGQELTVLRGHQAWVKSANFSPNGELIVTASDDKTVRLWDVSGREIAVLKGHQDKVNSAQFSPDGTRIVTASWDGTARIWRVETLDQLLDRACNYLHDYLTNNPEGQKVKAELCPEPSR